MDFYLALSRATTSLKIFYTEKEINAIHVNMKPIDDDELD